MIYLRLALICALLAASPAFAHAPVAGAASVFATPLPGPEGLAFGKRELFVANRTGVLSVVRPDGSVGMLVDLATSLSGIAVLRDGDLAVAAYDDGVVWRVDPELGTTQVLASGIGGPNVIVQTRRGRILVSASADGTVVDIASGTPQVLLSGLTFPNGLALGRDGYLYIAETFANRISRSLVLRGGLLAPAQVFSTGVSLPDGIAFDREGTLLVTGADALRAVAPNGTGSILSSDALLNWPASVAFGGRRGFGGEDLFLTNYGLPLGSGMEIIRIPYNHRGGRLIR